ncbi:uncharacterized protein N7506_002429 [Penicillium brevicompactum]|uniref:uncharacterized protein n=1 Tax=Penicillium brevicompactum TaxID=5074 RepID=UPI00253FC723|nr:uncharacterized protein N7506_002429 [Penicillium brevicompactum]KAJ5349176.1 hypothetical protein N7506_002429 [Penicillium brevicompactum]
MDNVSAQNANDEPSKPVSSFQSSKPKLLAQIIQKNRKLPKKSMKQSGRCHEKIVIGQHASSFRNFAPQARPPHTFRP